MYLLQQSISPVTGFVRRNYLTNIRVEHPICILFDPHGLPSFPSLDHNLYLTILLPLRLQDAAKGSNGINLVRGRFIYRCVVLSGQKDISLARHRLLQSPYGTWTTDLKGNFRKWENHNVTDGHHGKTLDV